MAEFVVQSGGYRSTIEATSFEEAGIKFLKGKNPERLGDLMRIRETPWNGRFHCDSGKEKRRGSWRYISLETGSSADPAGITVPFSADEKIALIEKLLTKLTERVSALEPSH